MTDFSLDRGLPASPDAEKAILGGIILEPNLIRDECGDLSTDEFCLDAHRRIYRCALELNDEGAPIDTLTLADRLGTQKELKDIGGVAYLSSLTDGVPRRTSISHYVRIVRDKARLRNLIHAANGVIARALDQSDPVDELIAETQIRLGELARSRSDENWRSLFHSYDEFAEAPTLRFAINGFLQEDGVTMIAGPSGDGKTLMMLAMVRALLNVEPLFGWSSFSVKAAADRVIYLVPEASIGPFYHRLQLFQLDSHIRSGKLLVRTLSSKEPMQLSDNRFLQAVQGAHVFLDTAIRFMEGDESAAGEAKVFAQTLFDVQAAGAKTITGAHHSPKSFDSADYMTLENVLRGSGDIGAMLATCWGIKQVDADSTRIFVQNVKPRDFQPCEPFIIEGRPHIDRHGTFLMVAAPGEAGELSDHQQRGKPGRKPNPESAHRQEQARSMRKAGESYGDIADKLGVSKSLAFKWAKGEGESFTNSVHGER